MALLNNSFHFIAPEFRQLTAMTAEWAYFFQFCARCLPATTVRNGSFPPRPVPHIFEETSAMPHRRNPSPVIRCMGVAPPSYRWKWKGRKERPG
jgi:hypothetical protein